jgi:predicted nucleic acid-binding protein
MSDSFIDSNVIVYLFDETDDRKRGVAATLVAEAVRDSASAISYQVVQEVLNVLSRLVAEARRSATAQSLLDEVLLPLWRVMPSRALYERALDVHARYQYRFYDSLIIAAALESGCTRLYSEDLQHGQRIERLTIENPFAS